MMIRMMRVLDKIDDRSDGLKNGEVKGVSDCYGDML
jgi:hypothetical protein